jgi:hypothetical protein
MRVRVRLFAVALLVSLAPAPVRADPKTIEVKYTEDGKMVVTESDGTSSGSAIKNLDVAELPRLLRQRGGKSTLLVLYASHCRACRALLPRVAKLGQKLRRRGLSVLAFSLDEDEGALREYIKRFQGSLEWMRLRWAKGQLAKEMRGLGVSVVGDTFSIPVYAIFDARRQLVREGTGNPPPQWVEKAIDWALKRARLAR